MRLKKLTIKGITRFSAPVTVDFEALGSGLVAIAGDNGAGKTTLLEAPYAALYTELPTRPGGLYGVAHGRDARIEVELESGGLPYRAMVAVDAVGQRTEAYLQNGDGSPITDGKVRSYLAETERRFGSARLMLAAALSSQNKRGSFLDLSKVDRKALLADILDTEGLQVLSESARARVRAGELALERARGQLAEAEAEIARLEAGTVDVDSARATRDRLAAELAEQQATVEDLRSRYSTVQAARAAAEEAVKGRARIATALDDVSARQKTLHGQREGLGAEKVALEGRIAKAREAAEADAARAPEYREAALALTAARSRRDDQRQYLTAADADVSAARHSLTTLRESQAAAASIRAQLDAAVARREDAQALAGRIGEYRDAIAAVEALRERRAVYQADLEREAPAVTAAREALTAKQREVAPIGAARAGLEAAKAQAELLAAVPCTAHGRWAPLIAGDLQELPDLRHAGNPVALGAECPLLASGRTSRDRVPEFQAAVSALELAEAEVPGLEAAVTNAEARVEATTREIAMCADALDDATAIAAAIAGAPEAAARVEREQAEIGRLSDEVAEVAGAESLIPPAQATLAAAEELRAATAAVLFDVEAEIARLEPVAAQLPVAEAAAQRLTELAAELAAGLEALDRRRAEMAEESERLAARRTALEGELADCPEVDVAGLDRQLADLGERGRQARVTVEQLQRRAQDAAAEVTRAEEATKRLAEQRGRADASREAIAVSTRDLGDWTVLERAFGRDGAQALLIDAAGPELSSLTNELLTATFGSRFEVKFLTQAPKADGRAMKEVMDLSIIDHERGREGAVDSLSGGEKVVISEAVSLALALYVGKHSGRRYETLFRDETASALDEQNAVRYITMLRKARDLGGFSQVIFVAHQSQTWAMADAVLYLADGNCEVRQ